MKNLVIEINETQPLEEVVKELERLGYESSEPWNAGVIPNLVGNIYAYDSSVYILYGVEPLSESRCLIITLYELKQMT